jgi:ATP-dependent DNA helicase DinG
MLAHFDLRRWSHFIRTPFYRFGADECIMLILAARSPHFSITEPIPMIALRDNFEDSSFAGQVRAMFGPEGLLGKARNFEFRAEQQRMAGAVAHALDEERHLVIEAGTGVGKSLAYLVPAVLHALEREKKAVISTHTINLQEQLIYKDIPIVKKLLPNEFEAALFKGRQNYLCPRRLERARMQSRELFTGPEQSALEQIYYWSLKTTDGSLSDLPREPEHNVWAQVCSEAHICTPKSCGPNSGCFYQAARQRVQAAQVVVLNHALFFVLLGAAAADQHVKQAAAAVDNNEDDAKEGYLFENDFVIFDEAHTVESVAARQIGIDVSQYGLRNALQRLYNPRTKKGLWTVLRHAEGVRLTSELLEDAEAFFQGLDKRSDFKRGGREWRVREPGVVEDTLGAGLEGLRGLIVETANRLDDEITKAEMNDLARRLGNAQDGVTTFLHQSEGNHVYWVERTGKTEQNLSLNAAPIDLSGILEKLLFRPDRSVIMTSATLSVGNSELGYFRERVGAMGEDIAAEQIGSPFDYKKQMKLFVATQMPESPRDPQYEAQLARWISHFVEQTKGRAFVLFTNYRLMQATSLRMRDFFEEKGWPLFVQGEGLSRRKMLESFKAGEGSVLFGTDSFWSGVDVPGEALSNVIITQLPFAPPDTPITEARCEFIRERGGDPFSEYSLPEAILKLRQGVGRLIRTRQDKGQVAILDSRVVRKPYGRAFLQALPKCPVEMVR